MPNEYTQKQLNSQFKAFKESLMAEINNTLKVKNKQRPGEDVVGELRQIKSSFESDLKQNFEVINSRVKRSEENLNEIMRKKRDHMDSIRDESLSSIEHQNTALSQEIKHVENVVKSKCEQNQARAIASSNIIISSGKDLPDVGEVSKRMDLLQNETNTIRKVIASNQEEVVTKAYHINNNEKVEKTAALVNKKLENLDHDMKRQIVEIQNSSQRDFTPQQKQDLVERRIQKLNGDSEDYYRTIRQLRSQVNEITQIHKLLQSQASTSSQEIVNRLEEKIAGLQKHIEELESQVRRQQPPKAIESIGRPFRGKPLELGDMQVRQPQTFSVETDVKANRMSYEARKEFREIKERDMKANSPRDEKNGGFPESGRGSVKYNGDPKVKSIIDEYHQKKKQGQVSSVDMKKSQKDQFLQQGPPVDLAVQQPRKYESGRSSSDKTPTKGAYDRQQVSSNYHTPQSSVSTRSAFSEQSQANLERLNAKKMKHAKILAQINYFINGTVSSLLDEDEDTEIYCNLDDDGYIFDEENDFVLDEKGNKVKLTTEQIEKFHNNNMIE